MPASWRHMGHWPSDADDENEITGRKHQIPTTKDRTTQETDPTGSLQRNFKHQAPILFLLWRIMNPRNLCYQMIERGVGNVRIGGEARRIVRRECRERRVADEKDIK